MDILLLILAILCAVIGVVGCIIPALPGPPLSYLSLWLIHWSGYVTLSTSDFVIWGIVTVVVTAIDFLLTPYMTRKFGGSKAAEWGSFIGLIVGLFIPIPFVGILIGPFLGAMIAEMLISKKDTFTSIHVALGAFISFFVGTGIKLIACIGMIAATTLTLL